MIGLVADSAFERKLLQVHSIVTVRGKRGRPVPVLIPADVKDILKMIADEDVRTLIRVNSEYLFANFGKFF